ncbi:unnamed protein product [marine sediment metagenome]|uniref:Uncharacterized protein n=1 Tax=marine sediment metagenome TaxID=412755 RepID=X1D9W9_9ZZZZ
MNQIPTLATPFFVPYILAEENSKLGIHIRGLINELYLDDLGKKTMRGPGGSKAKGV